MNDSKNQSESQTLPLFSVYVIWCSKTNMHYIGITKQKVRRRIRQHRRGKRQLIDREIQKLGWEGNFDWWLVEEHIPADQISEREQYWVATFDSVYPNGYNKTCGGISKLTVSDDTREILRQNALARDLSGENNPNFGKKHTDEAREIIRQARVGKPPWNKGITCSEEQKAVLREKALERDISGENNPFFGKHHTEEAKEKNRQAHLGKPGRKGIPCSEEAKAKLRAKALERDMSGENNPFFGKHHTDETKAVLSAKMSGENGPMYGRSPTNKGVPRTDEEKARMSAAQTGENNSFFGKHHTEQAKEAIRQAHLGTHHTEETKAQMRQLHLGKKHSEETKALMREKALDRAAAKRAAKAVAKENLAAANSTPKSLSILSDAVILQQCQQHQTR